MFLLPWGGGHRHRAVPQNLEFLLFSASSLGAFLGNLPLEGEEQLEDGQAEVLLGHLWVTCATPRVWSCPGVPWSTRAGSTAPSCCSRLRTQESRGVFLAAVGAMRLLLPEHPLWEMLWHYLDILRFFFPLMD